MGPLFSTRLVLETVRATTAGTYRVLSTVDETGELILVDRSDYEPTRVEAANGASGSLADLRAGYLIDAELSWEDERARLEAYSVEEWTLFTFKRGVSNLFEVALDTWAEAQSEGLGVNSSVTYSNDGAPNGALYTFASPAGGPDVFAEFQDGRRPLEPLLEQVEAEPPYEVFVFRPATHDFVLVYIVLAKESILADTVRDTYDCGRPSEPLRP
jgi:hypothetical protein